MDWKAQTGRERDMLMHIVALLLALADLAERSAGRSALVRWRVMRRLWQAHDVARVFAAGRAPNAAGGPPAETAVRHGPADAMALAASLRLLALVVSRLAARLRRSVPRIGGELNRSRSRLVQVPAAVAPVAFRDTS